MSTVSEYETGKDRHISRSRRLGLSPCQDTCPSQSVPRDWPNVFSWIGIGGLRWPVQHAATRFPFSTACKRGFDASDRYLLQVSRTGFLRRTSVSQTLKVLSRVILIVVRASRLFAKTCNVPNPRNVKAARNVRFYRTFDNSPGQLDLRGQTMLLFDRVWKRLVRHEARTARDTCLYLSRMLKSWRRARSNNR